MTSINLLSDGDDFEKIYYTAFIKDYFSNYEKFWLKFIVPLTNRPTDITLKNNSQLTAINKTDHDIHIAQLHYTTLIHLGRVWDILQEKNLNFNSFSEGFSRLIGAQDVAFELLERHRNQNIYTPFDRNSSKNAREKWIMEEVPDEIKNIRWYRNSLLHGSMPPQIIFLSYHLVPKIGFQEQHSDWRSLRLTEPLSNLSDTDAILLQAWEVTINYLQKSWGKIL